MKKFPLVLIEWEDSVLGFQGWKYPNDQKHKVSLFTSVGFLMYEDDKCKVLYPNVGQNNSADPMGSADITIPKSAIKKIIKLKY